MRESEGQYHIHSPSNTLRSMRNLMIEVCELILEYRSMVPIVPVLCLPTSSKEMSLVPLLFQAATNLRMADKEKFWPVSEITTIRMGKETKGRIDLGLFSQRHITLLECKAVRSKVSNTSIEKAVKAMQKATEQLETIDLKALFFKEPDVALKNYRANNKLIAMVAVNVTMNAQKVMNESEVNRRFEEKLETFKLAFPMQFIASIRYQPHFVNEANDQFHDTDGARRQLSVGHIFVLKEASWKHWS